MYWYNKGYTDQISLGQVISHHALIFLRTSSLKIGYNNLRKQKILVKHELENTCINSLSLGRWGKNSKYMYLVFKQMQQLDSISIYGGNALKWMPQNRFANKSTLVQVMAWCHQATSHYLSQCWPWSMTSYDITKPQWDNIITLIELGLVLPSISDIFSCDQAALWMVFSVCLSVRLSVCPSHLFDYVPIIISSWNFQALSPRTRVTSMQKVKVRGQRSRSQRSQPNLAVSGL